MQLPWLPGVFSVRYMLRQGKQFSTEYGCLTIDIFVCVSYHEVGWITEKV